MSQNKFERYSWKTLWRKLRTYKLCDKIPRYDTLYIYLSEKQKQFIKLSYKNRIKLYGRKLVKIQLIWKKIYLFGKKTNGNK